MGAGQLVARVGATVLDQLVIAGVVFVAAVPAALIAGDGGVADVMLVVLALFALAYPIVMPAFDRGQTVGKQVVRVRVLKGDGKPIGLGRAFVREIVKIVFGYTGVLWLVDVLWPLWHPENRALHDLIAGTRVVEA